MHPFSINLPMPYTLTRHQLYLDLHEAYLDARRHKRSKTYQQEFERDIYWQLEYLCEELFTRTYKPQPCTCFIIEDPKKREMHCRHYGRYVDDYYVVSTDKAWLRSLIPSTRIFLREELGLTVNEGKTQISDVRYGVSYLGAYLKPWRKYVSSQSMQRMIKHIRQLRYEVLTMENDNLPQNVIADKIQHSLNSFLGVMGHYNSFRRREKLFLDSNMLAFARRYGSFDRNISKFVPYANDNR